MTDARQYGPLPALLVAMTAVTGLVDSFSYLNLGHTFVANMTGNVIFLGFVLAGVHGGVSLITPLLALTAFLCGATIGGRWAGDRPIHRGRLLAAATAIQSVPVLAAAVLATVGGTVGLLRHTEVGLLAFAMGGQNALVARLAVPDLTTTVVTRTITFLVAGRVPQVVQVRRAAGVLAILGGAFVGGTLLRWVGVPAPLWLAVASLAGCSVTGYLQARRPTAEAWR